MKGRGRWIAGLAALSLPACSPARSPERGTDTTSVAPADSLVFRTRDGFEIWFAAGRQAHDPAGETCFERAILIRRDTVSRGVPLLYTLEAPVRLDDTTMRAVLYSSCRPAGAYRVDFATASPRRLPAGQ